MISSQYLPAPALHSTAICKHVQDRENHCPSAREVSFPSSVYYLALTPLAPCHFLNPCSILLTTYSHNRISEGAYYEAHQQLRVVASRYVKQENWTAAIDILHGGALALLKAGQGGSGGDLCMYMVDVYRKGGVEVNGESKGTGDKSLLNDHS